MAASPCLTVLLAIASTQFGLVDPDTLVVPEPQAPPVRHPAEDINRLLRAELLTDAVGHQKIAGQPFRVAELVDVIENLLPSGGDAPRPTAVA